jgi:hypothetical protein
MAGPVWIATMVEVEVEVDLIVEEESVDEDSVDEDSADESEEDVDDDVTIEEDVELDCNANMVLVLRVDDAELDVEEEPIKVAEDESPVL